MTCDQVQQLLDDFVDGILPEMDRSRLETHLAGCDSCRRSLAELQTLLDNTAIELITPTGCACSSTTISRWMC